MIFFFDFLRCLEKVHDNKEFSRGNSKSRRESRITTRQVEPCVDLASIIYSRYRFACYQQVFICSKSVIGPIEKCVEYVKS